MSKFWKTFRNIFVIATLAVAMVLNLSTDLEVSTSQIDIKTLSASATGSEGCNEDSECGVTAGGTTLFYRYTLGNDDN